MRWMVLAGRIFVSTGVVFGLIQGVVHRSVVTGIAAGIFFGLAMAIVLTALTAVRTRGRPGSLGVKHRAEIFMSTPPARVHNCVLDAFTLVPAKVTQNSATSITARTRTSWQSWGEVLTADIRPVADGTALVVTSRPWLRGTVADYGRNQENVTLLRERLQGALPHTPHE